MASYFKRAQKNKVFRRIEELGLNPKDFSWFINDHNGEESIFYRQDEYYFSLVYSDSEYFDPGYEAKFAPGEQGPLQVVYSKDMGSIMLHVLNVWLPNLKLEVEEPDFWENLSRLIPEVDFTIHDSGESVFSETEQHLVLQGIDDVKLWLMTKQEWDEAQAKYIESEFESLKEQIHLPRKTFFKYLKGVILDMAVKGMLNRIGTELLTKCSEKFAGVITNLPSLLP